MRIGRENQSTQRKRVTVPRYSNKYHITWPGLEPAFWDVASNSLKKITDVSEEHTISIFLGLKDCLVLASCQLLELLCNPEDEGSTTLRNVGNLLLDYMELHPRKQYSP